MPEGEFPSELWPVDALRTATTQPAGWLTVEQLTTTDQTRDGRGCILVAPDRAAATLQHTHWAGRDLGDVEIWSDGTFEPGLTKVEDEVELEFFVQVRQPTGAALPVIEIAYPFLWYWDAYPANNGWEYLNHAGRACELIRYERTSDSWKVEIRALEFRQYLAACGKSAVMQVEFSRYADESGFERVDDTFRNEWAHMHFAVLSDRLLRRPAFSCVMGQYILTGQRGPRVPRFEERNQDSEYPSFVYKIDPDTHAPLKHTCDPAKLGTYFDRNGDRLHYLTPVYFKREVLQPYAAEPTRYRITATHLACFNLWGIDIGFNSVGLVEVYLGDLGRSLPSDEWGHWLTHNVPPDGNMEEGRFRRDFLNQWANSKDIPGDLRRAREKASEVSEKLLGKPIWRPLTGHQGAEFESMVGPLNEDPASLGKSLLILPIAMVDGIDPAPLKTYLGGANKDEKSLSLLQRFTEQLGDEDNCTAVLRKLWDFRSQGGVAHLAGSQAPRARADLGITDMTNLEAFESVVKRITDFLCALIALMEQALAQNEEQS